MVELNAAYWFISRSIQCLVPIYTVFCLFKKRSLSKRKSDQKKNQMRSKFFGSEVDDFIAGNTQNIQNYTDKVSKQASLKSEEDHSYDVSVLVTKEGSEDHQKNSAAEAHWIKEQYVGRNLSIKQVDIDDEEL